MRQSASRAEKGGGMCLSGANGECSVVSGGWASARQASFPGKERVTPRTAQRMETLLLPHLVPKGKA